MLAALSRFNSLRQESKAKSSCPRELRKALDIPGCSRAGDYIDRRKGEREGKAREIERDYSGRGSRKNETKELEVKRAHGSLTTHLLTHTEHNSAPRRGGSPHRDVQRGSSLPDKMCVRILGKQRNDAKGTKHLESVCKPLPHEGKQQATLKNWEANKAGAPHQAQSTLHRLLYLVFTGYKWALRVKP